MLTFLNIAYSTARGPFLRRPTSFCARLLFAGLLVLSSFSAISAQQPAPLSPLLITEVFYNTPAIDAEEEWVELANLGAQSIDLSYYRLGDEEERGGGEGMLQFPAGSLLHPGQVIVVAQSARGFSALYGRNPDFEIVDTDATVTDMVQDREWASGSFALANDGDELLLLDADSEILDALNYGDKTTFFSPAAPLVGPGQSIARLPASCDTNSTLEWKLMASPAPGSIDTSGACSPELVPLDAVKPLLAIGQIQGSGPSSPYENGQVMFDAIVTGMHEDQNSAGTIYYTLFVQDPPGQEDGDPRTSDGMVIFHGRQRPPYSPGDRLQVSGTVIEYYGLTEIDDRGLQIELLSSGNSLPSPLMLAPSPAAADSLSEWEAYEGMLVSLAQPAQVVGPTHSGCGFALIDANTAQPPLPRRSASQQIPQPFLVLHHSDVDCTALPSLKRGDRVTGLAGPLTYHFDQFKIVLQDTSALTVQAASLPLVAPALRPHGDQFTVATFNVNNYFDSQSDLPDSAEPVVPSADLRLKQRKLGAAIGQTLGCPTIVALQEVENEPLLASLVVETAQFCGFTYQIAHRDSRDSRGLDLALLADPRRVALLASSLHQGCTSIDTALSDTNDVCPAGQYPLFGRPPLRVDLQVDGHPYVIINNHFKSKREGEAETAARRLEQARHVAQLAAELRAADPQVSLIVLGDFNDYEDSATLRELTVAGDLINTMERIPLPQRYTYIFDGIPQLLDNMLIAPALLPHLAGVTIAHTNADYPVDFSLDISPSGLPFHASDHDVPMALFNLPGSASSPSPEPAAPSPLSPTATMTPAPEPTTAPEPSNSPTAELRPTASPTAEVELTASPSAESRPTANPSNSAWPWALLLVPVLALLALLVWRRP